MKSNCLKQLGQTKAIQTNIRFFLSSRSSFAPRNLVRWSHNRFSHNTPDERVHLALLFQATKSSTQPCPFRFSSCCPRAFLENSFHCSFVCAGCCPGDAYSRLYQMDAIRWMLFGGCYPNDAHWILLGGWQVLNGKYTVDGKYSRLHPKVLPRRASIASVCYSYRVHLKHLPEPFA